MALASVETAILFASAIGAGVMNALAGGGTLLTFPALLFLGESAIVANATSTVALLPGAAASLVGYRREVATHRRWLRTLLLPSLLGGAAGSLLLLATPERLFARLAPWLVLFATALFAFQWMRAARSSGMPKPEGGMGPVACAVGQLLIALYGGYFGAGIGILMLVLLGAMGLSDIHAMNGLKNFFGICINGVAAAIFVVSGQVDWSVAAVLAAGSILGGFGGARLGRALGQSRARAAVVAIGVLAALLLFVHRRPPMVE